MARIALLTTVHDWQDPRVRDKQAVSLRQAGHDVYLLAPRKESTTYQGVHVLALEPGANRGGPKAVLRRIRRQWQCYRHVAAMRPDAVHIHDPELIPLARLIQWRTGAKILYDIHEDYRAGRGATGRILRRLERWSFSWVDHVVLAEVSYGSILDGYSVPRSIVLNYARAPDWVSEPKTRSEGELLLLYTGTLAHTRGLRTMLELARIFRDRGCRWRLRLVGICRIAADRRDAEDYIQRFSLQDVVERVGWSEYVPPESMQEHYREADVGLALLDPHPNFVGSVPTKLYEYVAAGIAVMASDVPLWRRFIRSYGCGAVVPAGDPQAAFDTLRRWADEPATIERLRAGARAAYGDVTWSAMEKRLLEAYAAVLDRADAERTARQER